MKHRHCLSFRDGMVVYVEVFLFALDVRDVLGHVYSQWRLQTKPRCCNSNISNK